jgi:hypothetical protein
MAEIPLTLALSPMERGQELLIPSPWGEGLGMRANHIGIQQRQISIPSFLRRVREDLGIERSLAIFKKPIAPPVLSQVLGTYYLLITPV